MLVFVYVSYILGFFFEDGVVEVRRVYLEVLVFDVVRIR